jgi:isoleucyl-tRNA synthetase
MPYGQVHYPFSTTEEKFQKIFPADFIAEGIDQTRGWFYTLNVISTALRNDAPYKNLIVNGIVLAADGKKMSKSKGNYTPLMNAAESMGADAIRLYIINSPLVKADSLSFKDEGVKEINKVTFLPWYNSFKMLLQSIQRFEQSTGKQFVFDENFVENKENLTNVMDSWITITSHNLTKYVRKEMESYRLYNVVPRVMEFLESLTNWYIKLNRPRIRGEKGE